MSAHSMKARRRHPDPGTYRRECFEVAHLTFEVAEHPENGVTFALIAGQALNARDRRPLFTGYVTPEMPAQLRALADRLEGGT